MGKIQVVIMHKICDKNLVNITIDRISARAVRKWAAQLYHTSCGFVNRHYDQKNKLHICATCIVCFVVGIIPHVFSLRTLVHIYIPHTYTPCGRCLYRDRSYCDILRLGLFPCHPSSVEFIISLKGYFVNPSSEIS